MDDFKRRGESKPPLYPKYKSSHPKTPSEIMFPSTLSKAFEKSPYYMSVDHEEAGESVAISPEKLADLYVPLPLNPEGEAMNKDNEINSSPVNQKRTIHQGVESGSSLTSAKRILTLDEAVEQEKKSGVEMEERKLRRTVSNRLSAQRSRMRKTSYIDELQNKINELQENVACLAPRLETCKQRQTMLRVQKAVLEQQLKSCMNRSTLCYKQIEEKQAEIRRLKEVYQTQKEQQMITSVANSTSFPIYPPQNHQRMLNSSFFQCESTPVVELSSSSDQGRIDQYLNYDAFGVASSKQS